MLSFIYLFIKKEKNKIPSLLLWCAMSPLGLWWLYRGAFFAAHGPSSLCVDFVNYLGCQHPTTANSQRGT